MSLLDDAGTLEELLQITGGIPVVVGGTLTWGHKTRRHVESGSGSGDYTVWTVIEVPSDVVAKPPRGQAVEMEGADWVVEGIAPPQPEEKFDDGALTPLLLRPG